MKARGQKISSRPVGVRLVQPSDLERCLRHVGRKGILEVTFHFKMRSQQRGFTTVEALNVLRQGVVAGGPDFCPDFCNWRYVIEGEHDQGTLSVVAAVSAGDPKRSASVVLITGFIVG